MSEAKSAAEASRGVIEPGRCWRGESKVAMVNSAEEPRCHTASSTDDHMWDGQAVVGVPKVLIHYAFEEVVFSKESRSTCSIHIRAALSPAAKAHPPVATLTRL